MVYCTNITQEHTASISKARDGDIMFFRNTYIFVQVHAASQRTNNDILAAVITSNINSV
jgi:hypothetical protein